MQINLASEIDRLFDDSSISHTHQPLAVILMGDVAAGKTTVRVKEYSRGYVVIDAAEMFHHMSRGLEALDFPGALLEFLEVVGPEAATRAIAERRNIVTEIIGAELAPTQALIGALESVGYRVEVIAITCDMEEAWRRNENRGDCISAYFAEAFQLRWLTDACMQLMPGPIA